MLYVESSHIIALNIRTFYLSISCVLASLYTVAKYTYCKYCKLSNVHTVPNIPIVACDNMNAT